MPRPVLPCAVLLATLLTGATASAQDPIPATTHVDEQIHTIEIALEPAGATAKVTRSLFNPTPFHTSVELPIPLPCAALLDELVVEQRGAGGALEWTPAELLSPADAQRRYDAYLDATFDSEREHVLDADTAVLLTREGWRCDAELRVHPVPPLSRRSFGYRVFVPSSYADGRYVIELPSFADYGLTPTIELAGLADPELEVSVDGQALAADGLTIADGQAHTIVLRPRDPARGHVRAADLDLAALVARTPEALALDGADQAQPRLLSAAFAAPRELAVLPPVRRAVIVLDGSRSLDESERAALQRLGAAYLDALAEQQTRVEILLFDREVSRVYHDFVPARWGAEDLPKLGPDGPNGSEIGLALATARALLAEPTTASGADWIIVLSDLELRTSFDLDGEREAAEASPVRMHAVRQFGSDVLFRPAAASDPWTAIARAAGGMAWQGSDPELADELVRPRRIWNLAVELELADGGHHSETIAARLEAGGSRTWIDAEQIDAALVRASFVGEIWGQRRAWGASPSELEARRLAGTIAGSDSRDLPAAVLTALAFHAGVISPYSSAWALARFDGLSPAPPTGFGALMGFGGRGSSSRCGGARCAGVRAPQLGFDTLVQRALDACGAADAGSLRFETTDGEIVDVHAGDACLTEQTWALDVRPTGTRGRVFIRVDYEGGLVSNVLIHA